MPSYPDSVRAAERAAIRRRYRRGSIGIAALRVAELNRELSDRYGGEALPDDDAGRDDVEVVLHHLARRHGDVLKLIDTWLRARAPWLVDVERDALLNRVLANPLKFRADTLAARIGLTADRRTRLKIRTIGAIDQTAAERAESRRLKKIAYKRRLRAARRHRSADEPA